MREKRLMYMGSPIGKLGIVEDGTGICAVLFESQPPADIPEGESGLLSEAAGQLREYFEGKRQVFDLPLSVQGTEFQKTVWKALLEIPYGETRSYGQIASAIGNPKASRAVGMANNRNPLAILIPCHRVVGANGKLVGYGGGLDKKTFLLELEARG